MQTVSEVFHKIDTYMLVRKNIDLLRCTANQASTDQKFHYYSKHPARAKLAAINNLNGCSTVEV